MLQIPCTGWSRYEAKFAAAGGLFQQSASELDAYMPAVRDLADTLSWLSEMGYRCFWQTMSHLVPASGECWSDAMVFADWGNLLCAHEPDVLGLFRTFVPTAPAELLRTYTTKAPHFKCMEKAMLLNASAALHPCTRAPRECLARSRDLKQE